jgi:hypothetical protein
MPNVTTTPPTADPRPPAGVEMTDEEIATEQEVMRLFADAPYTTNALSYAFKGATRSEVLIIAALMDTLAVRMDARTWDNAMSLNTCITVLVARLVSLRSAPVAERERGAETKACHLGECEGWKHATALSSDLTKFYRRLETAVGIEPAEGDLTPDAWTELRAQLADLAAFRASQPMPAMVERAARAIEQQEGFGGCTVESLAHAALTAALSPAPRGGQK